jgi:hypothetical protein
MTMQQRNGWADGWTADRPASIRYAWAPNDGGEYVQRGDGFAYRDLHLEDVSDGALGCQRFHVVDAAQVGEWRRLANDFDFVFVVSGSVDVESTNGELVHLSRWSSALHPRGYRYHLVHPSEDLDAVHITAPAVLATADDEDEVVGDPVYTHDSEDAYVHGGLRPFFAYRDLGTTEATDGRILIHIAAASLPSPDATWPDPAPRTGWHYHTMAQWFMVLDGSAITAIEDNPPQQLSYGGAQCLGRGPTARHNVTAVTPEYRVIELCMPADYDTIAVAPPEGAAP